MREILFRGKCIDTEEWIYGWYEMYPFERFPVRPCIVPIEGAKGGYYEHIEVDPITIGQYTGLTDKNGVKIFEGDIVLVNDSTESPYLFEVKFGTCGGVKNVEHKVGYVGFYFSVITDSKWIKSSLRTDPIYFLSDLGCEAKVIGNIHDNPELLK